MQWGLTRSLLSFMPGRGARLLGEFPQEMTPPKPESGRVWFVVRHGAL
jgi:hypothetical protein